MKRFQSSLERLLRVREQAERMAQLNVSRARGELDAATKCLLASQSNAARQRDELSDRLQTNGHPWAICQASQTLHELELHVQAMMERRAGSQALLDEVLAAYHEARQQRELLERLVTRQRDEHRRQSLKAAAIDLQEWSLRPANDHALEASKVNPHA